MLSQSPMAIVAVPSANPCKYLKRSGRAQEMVLVAMNVMKIWVSMELETKKIDRRINRNLVESATKTFCQSGRWP